ncbi:MAG: NAD(P)/FAD-dependent oxidoreductase, partial [Christensenellales bacterium]
MNIYIIGGGAAGIMAAIYAKEKDNRVIVLEKNEKIGKKIYITGKGRCNITNIADYEDYFSNIVSNKNFLRGAIKKFPPEKMIKLLNDNGLSTKVERGGRVFPQSDKSNDVIKTFEKILKQKGVEIRYNQSVMAFSVRNSRIQKIITQ